MPKPRGDSVPTQLRVATHDTILIDHAAQALGISKNSFMVQASIEKARSVMDSVDKRRYDAFLEAIESAKQRWKRAEHPEEESQSPEEMAL